MNERTEQRAAAGPRRRAFERLGQALAAWLVTCATTAIAADAAFELELALACGLGGAALALAGLTRPRPAAGSVVLALALATPLAIGASALIAPGRSSIALAALLGVAALATTIAVRERDLDTERSLVRSLLALAAYVLALWLVFAGSIDLIPEEAYYWCYSRHPALGYLDHPPLIAWLIAGGTWLVGDHEIGVRLGALLCGAGTLAILHATTKRAHGPRAAWVAVGLAATVPYVFAGGIIATPDAPLLLAWAGTLMFARRAVLDDEPRAWLGAGACLGLGLLAKYSIVLLALGIVGFVLSDRRARGALRRPWAWAGLLVALVSFAPVLVWNARNDWASFAYQSGRAARAFEGLHLHELVGGAILTAAPMLLIAIGRWLLRRGATSDEQARRTLRFLTWTTLVPLAAFTLQALQHTVRLHWTGPIWVAWIPSVAGALARPRERSFALRPRAWLISGTLSAVFFAWVLAQLATSFAPLPAPRRMRLPFAWDELVGSVMSAKREIEQRTGRPVALVGMDRNFLASEMAFYGDGGRSWREVTSRHLFGRTAIMFEQWTSPADWAGADMLLVCVVQRDVEAPSVVAAAQELGPVQHVVVSKRGRALGEIWLRELHGYRPPARDATPAAIGQ